MSGGFEPKPKLYQIIFAEDSSWAGLEVTAKGVSTEGYLEMSELAEAMGSKPKAAETRKLMRRWARFLVAWNITRNGEPVPPVYALCIASGKPPLRGDPYRCEEHADDEDSCEWEGLAALDQELALEIFQRWSQAVAGVDPTSPARSNGGVTSQEAPPPGLASASVSLRDSSTPN